jgi:hypothetical protein
VDQAVQGVPEALAPKWLTGNRLRPSDFVWSGENTLLGGVETLFLGGEAPYGDDIEVAKGAWRAFVSSQVVLLGETW